MGEAVRDDAMAGGRTVLVVEDEPIIALAVKATLARHGYEVVQAASGEDAIRMADEHPEIALILMDINLGAGLDGTEAARVVLATHEVPLVFHSSHTEPDVVERTEGITSYGYIVKNTGETVLLASMKMAFRLFEARRREAEARAALTHQRDLMRYVIEHNRGAVAIHDRELRYLYVSRAYLAQYGVAERDIIGERHYDVFPDLPEKWRVVHRNALAGAVSSGEEDVYPRADGTFDVTRWECRPWYEADGSIGGIVVYTEVYERRDAAGERLPLRPIPEGD
ncbi:MAG: response regulator [Spirochaetales bacterium]|nr:response regulator [Spirochaetales bacterium]